MNFLGVSMNEVKITPFEMSFKVIQNGNEYVVSDKYWHSDPPSIEYFIDFVIRAGIMLGYSKEDIEDYFAQE